MNLPNFHKAPTEHVHCTSEPFQPHCAQWNSALCEAALQHTTCHRNSCYNLSRLKTSCLFHLSVSHPLTNFFHDRALCSSQHATQYPLRRDCQNICLDSLNSKYTCYYLTQTNSNWGGKLPSAGPSLGHLHLLIYSCDHPCGCCKRSLAAPAQPSPAQLLSPALQLDTLWVLLEGRGGVLKFRSFQPTSSHCASPKMLGQQQTPNMAKGPLNIFHCQKQKQ